MPVKTLLRFRCVSKPWLKLISKPYFIAAHLNHHSSPLQHPNTLLLHTWHDESKDHLLSLLNPPPDLSVIELDYPFPFFYGDVVAGSCNGIVCLSSDVITLWNPAMRLSMTVQLSRTKPLLGVHFVSMGFAYDSQDNVFIILSLLSTTPQLKFAPDEVEMCSTKTFTWKKLKNDIGFRVRSYCCNVIVKGVPYWSAVTEDEHGLRDVLICFDVGRKAFDKLPMPGIRMGTKWYPVDLKGSLGMVVSDENEKSFLDVWVMDDEDGWSKKYNVGPVFGFERIIGCSRDGDIVAEKDNGGVLIMFDPVTSSIKVKAALPFDNAKPGISTFFSYSESLVLITGMTPVRKQTARDKLAREKFLKKCCPTCSGSRHTC